MKIAKTVGDSVTVDAVPPTETQPAALRRRAKFWPLGVAAGAFGLWLMALAVMAWQTANPVTLNQEQIARSPYVVSAKRVSDDRQLLAVHKEWKRGEPMERVRVENLEEVDMEPGQVYLVPLSFGASSGSYVVTPTSLPNDEPLIYPANAEAFAQLQELLGKSDAVSGK